MPLSRIFNRNKVHPIKDDEEIVSTTEELQMKRKLQNPSNISASGRFFDRTFLKCLARKKKMPPTENVPAVSIAERSASSFQPLGGAKVKVMKEAADGHTRVGQALSYDCMQRVQRNVPVYLWMERRREDRDLEKVLVLPEVQKFKPTLQREQAKQMQKLEEKKKPATFRLGTAEQLKAKKKARPLQSEDSYILKERPSTLPTLPNILELTEQAHKQCFLKEKLNARRLQVLLAEDSTRQRAHDFEMKKEAEEKPRARSIHAGNLKTAKRTELRVKTNEALSGKLSEQREDIKMPQPSLMKFTAKQLTGLNLQKGSWQYDAKMRLVRDPEEKAFIRSSERLLLEKSREYRSCYQRMISLINCGKSDIFKDFDIKTVD